MVHQITELLRGPVKLPLLIRVIGYLRRMQNTNESDLAVCFLQQRDAFIESLLDNIKETDPSAYCRKYIDITRILINLGEHFFDLTTHYKAIFTDHPHCDPMTVNAIFSSYCNHRLHHFSTVIELTLDHPDLQISHILSIMNQTMYFGMSLGRVGLDFRSLLVPLFEKAILNRVTAQLHEAMMIFQQGNHDKDPSQQDLLGYPALGIRVDLAQLFNRYMTVFNQMRTCCPLGLVAPLTSLVNEHFSLLPQDKLCLVFKSQVQDAMNQLFV